MNDSPLLVVTALCDKNIPLLAELRQLGTVVVGDSARGPPTLQSMRKSFCIGRARLRFSGTCS
jgi:hypothetical protein